MSSSFFTKRFSFKSSRSFKLRNLNSSQCERLVVYKSLINHLFRSLYATTRQKNASDHQQIPLTHLLRGLLSGLRKISHSATGTRSCSRRRTGNGVALYHPRTSLPTAHLSAISTLKISPLSNQLTW